MGEEHNENKRPFLIEGKPSTNSTDEIQVEYDSAWSALRTGRAGRDVYAYVAVNVTKGHRYSCEFFKNDDGEQYAFCNCLSRSICKHIVACLGDLPNRKEDDDRTNSR